MFWYNVISHNSSYYFKMYISEITKKIENGIMEKKTLSVKGKKQMEKKRLNVNNR